MDRPFLGGLMLGLVAVTARADVAVDPPVLARGRYLVEVAAYCGACHNTLDVSNKPVPGMKLAGGRVLGERGYRSVAPNITPDLATGIGAWSDAEIAGAIRNGRHRDGQPIGPPMPVALYSQLADADVTAIVAYLRAIPPVAHRVTERSRYDFAVPTVAPVAHVAPPADTPVERGRYLAGPIAHCVWCHTPADAVERRDWSRIGAGGEAFTGPWGAAVSANITSDKSDGIGTWSDARLIAELTTGVDPDGRRLAPPMAGRVGVWRQLTPRDMADLIAYLRTLPPQS